GRAAVDAAVAGVDDNGEALTGTTGSQAQALALRRRFGRARRLRLNGKRVVEGMLRGRGDVRHEAVAGRCSVGLLLVRQYVELVDHERAFRLQDQARCAVVDVSVADVLDQPP